MAQNPHRSQPEVRRIVYKTLALQRLVRKASPSSSPPPAFARKNSPSTPQNANFGPFFVRRANFVALTPTIRPSRENFFARVDAGPPAHHRSPQHKERDRAWPRRPRAVVWRGRGTRGQYPLQTSSNRSNLERLPRTPVTNVVNLRPKTTIFSEKAVRLTTFATTRIGASQNPSTTSQTILGVRGTCRGARGRWRGLAGQRADAPSEARSAGGSRAGHRPRAHTAARPDGARNTSAPQAAPVPT